MTLDGLAFFFCHEIGHHLGGKPLLTWYSAEGQADYFATSKCLKMIWQNENNEAVVSTLSLPQNIRQQCRISNKSSSMEALCLRSMSAANVAARVLAKLKDHPLPRFHTPTRGQVRSTNFGHPLAQCRLDTMVAGVLGKPRPACWFK